MNPVNGVVPSPLEANQAEETVAWRGAALDPREKSALLKILFAWPESITQKLTQAGRLRITNLTPQQFAQKFPRATERGEKFYWRAGELFLAKAEAWVLNPWAPLELLPLRTRLAGTWQPSGAVVRRERSFLIPTDTRLLAHRMVHRFVSQGFLFRPASYLHANLRITETVGNPGESTHQLRLRTTNPQFNRAFYQFLVDPLVPLDLGLEFYAGVFSTATTRPTGVVGAVLWGVDSRLFVLSGYDVFLDSSLLHRVRSSKRIPSDEIALEGTFRIQSKDRSRAFGIALQGSPSPRPHLTGSLMSRMVWR